MVPTGFEKTNEIKRVEPLATACLDGLPEYTNIKKIKSVTLTLLVVIYYHINTETREFFI